jgi:hypothetical protein
MESKEPSPEQDTRPLNEPSETKNSLMMPVGTFDAVRGVVHCLASRRK